MSRARWVLIIVLLSPLLGGATCQKRPNPDTPASGVVPQLVTVTEVRYRDLPAELLEDCPIAEGSIPEIGEVAAARKLSLQQCNADKAALRALQGTKP